MKSCCCYDDQPASYLMCASVLGLHSVEFPPPLALGTNTFDQAEIIMNSTVLLVCQAMTN